MVSRFSGEIGFSSLTLLPPSLTPPFMKRPVGSWFDHLTPTERLAELGGKPIGGTPEDFGKVIAAETAKWEKVVISSGAKVE